LSSATQIQTLSRPFTSVNTTEFAIGVPTVVKVYRVVVGFLVASLVWKCQVYPSMFYLYSSLRLRDGFFPNWLSNPIVLAAMIAVPVVLGILIMFIRTRWALRLQAFVTLACMFVLCIHQGSYNDVTFLTCFWAAAWCAWYTTRLGDPEQELLAKGKTLGLLIISMIFLGGAVGKWTPGYWSGEVLYEIYFVDRDFWFFNLLRARMEPEALRDFATCYSRMVVITETACAFLWLLPPKVGSAIALIVFLGIAIFSNVYLFSVMFCLFGLTIVGMHESKPRTLNPLDQGIS
jgi:hypothetical protein